MPSSTFRGEAPPTRERERFDADAALASLDFVAAFLVPDAGERVARGFLGWAGEVAGSALGLVRGVRATGAATFPPATLLPRRVAAAARLAGGRGRVASRDPSPATTAAPERSTMDRSVPR